MKINVQMLAFEEPGKVRTVDIPDHLIPIPEPQLFESQLNIDNLLELTFHFGQNDFQPQECCSLSAGDVAEVNNKLYLCRFMGWAEISPSQLDEYKSLDRRDRQFCPLMTYNGTNNVFLVLGQSLLEITPWEIKIVP